MGVLVPDGITSPVMQSRVSLSARDAVVDIGETNNNVRGLMDANSLPPPTPTRVVDIIDIVNGGEPPRHNSDWIPPPPKKKWIRHYLLGEILHQSRDSNASRNKNTHFCILSKNISNMYV
jgi:hypothetical protein